MTTPGGVPNLPQGALTLDTIASKTQDMTTAGMRGRTNERVSSIFGSSTGGNIASDLSPFGIIAGIFSGFSSVVANADPADITGPEDLPGLLLDFIESLPFVGQFVDLFEAILGNYTGDDTTLLGIQTLFAPIRAIADVLTGLAGGSTTGALTSWLSPSSGGSGIFGPLLAGIPGVSTLSGLFGFLAPTGSTTTTNVFSPLLSGIPGISTVSGLLGFLQPSGSGSGIFGPLLNNLVDGASGTTGSTGTTLNGALSALQTLFGNVTGASASASNALSSITTLQSALTTLTPTAITAALQSTINTLILGNRTNKSAAMGANPTSQTSITAGHFSSGGSLITSSLTAGNAIGQRYTVPEDATYGFVDILGSGTSVTSIFLNIFKIDPTTNAKTALFNSSNIASLIPSSLSDHTRVLLPSMPATAASDELLLEIVNGGTNALTLVTKATAMPNNSNEVIQNVGFSRATSAGGNSPSSLTSGQGSYAGTVPYAVIGITDVPADYHVPDAERWSTPGTYSSIAWPSWLLAGDTADLIGIGGGGGGGCSAFYASGQGGGCAAWAASTLVMDTDIKLGSSYTVVVGAAGTGGVGGGAATNGGNSTFTYTDPSNVSHTITFTGGPYGGLGPFHNGANPNSGSGGQGASNTTYDGITYYGGAAVGMGAVGLPPGGGGGGAIPYLNGQVGGAGEVDLYMKKA